MKWLAAAASFLARLVFAALAVAALATFVAVWLALMMILGTTISLQ